jgi:hypothetical protein
MTHRVMSAPVLSPPRTSRARQSITLDALFYKWHNPAVAWEVEGTDEFAGWFGGLHDDDKYLQKLTREGLI